MHLSEHGTIPLKDAANVARLLWPTFVQEHECIFLEWHSGSNPPPPTDNATGWECFINHTHVFDEFANGATNVTSLEECGDLVVEEEMYNEAHPDFALGCEVGQTIARLWAIKLKLDFPTDRFRVYYTQYDNPIVRFHKVRPSEAPWLSNEALRAATDPSFRNAVIYDTEQHTEPIRRRE